MEVAATILARVGVLMRSVRWTRLAAPAVAFVFLGTLPAVADPTMAAPAAPAAWVGSFSVGSFSVGSSAAGSAAAGSPSAGAAAPVSWAPCQGALARTAFECATLVVPMDRRDPGGDTVALALVRHRATGPATDRIGSLVANPGGPGGSGLGSIRLLWRVLPASVRQRFDLVSWDPRGIGQTVPALAGCATPRPVRPATGPVSWAAVVTAYARLLGAANASCQRRNEAFVEHIGTMEAIADLDRIRAAVGDDRLTYWGMSYGTRIGYVYALTHPDRVRALVLDGSVDPAGTLLGLTERAPGRDQAFGTFGQAYPVSAARFREVLAALQRGPILLPDGSSFDRWTLIDLVLGFDAQQAAYSAMAGWIATAHAAVLGSDSEQAAARAALVPLRALVDGVNADAGAGFSVVNCLDYAQRPTLAQSVAAVRRAVRLGPYYGGTMATMASVGCAGLTVRPDPVPVITGQGPDVPVLIAGSTRDGATIMQWTARMSRAFPASRTVTYAGGQHVVWGLSASACASRYITHYVLTTVLPAMDVACSNDLVPVE